MKKRILPLLLSMTVVILLFHVLPVYAENTETAVTTEPTETTEPETPDIVSPPAIETEPTETEADKAVKAEAKCNPTAGELKKYKKNTREYTVTGFTKSKGTVKNECYMRKLPGTKEKPVCTLTKNSKVTVTGMVAFSGSKIWYKVKTSKGKTGFLAGNLIKVTTRADKAVKTESKKNPTAKELKKYKNKIKGYTVVSLKGYTGKIKAECYIRKSPSTTERPTNILKKNTKVTVLGKITFNKGKKVWYKVKTSKGKTGFVAGNLLSVTKPSKKNNSSSNSSSGEGFGDSMSDEEYGGGYRGDTSSNHGDRLEVH